VRQNPLSMNCPLAHPLPLRADAWWGFPESNRVVGDLRDLTRHRGVRESWSTGPMKTSARPSGTEKWATEEFGEAQLGNSLRTARVVAMARSALAGPSGLVSEVFREGEEREGAYNLLENEHVSAGELCSTTCRAAARRAIGMPYVFAPVDGSSLALAEYEGEAERDVGLVGAHDQGGTGLLVMNAVVIDPLGVPLGLFGQQWWTRKGKVKKHRYDRPLAEKETQHWLATMNLGLAEWTKVNPETRLWFQLDRGGDFREALEWAGSSDHWVTVRAAHDRRTVDAEEKYLWATLEAAEVRGGLKVELERTKKRKARTAKLSLRYSPVTLRLRDRLTMEISSVTLWALLASEQGRPADGSEPVEWLLLTNHEINSLRDAELVLFGYTQRWRIEQFHRTWKSVCGVEETQLRETSNIQRWATILAAVAMRLLRLTYFARFRPELPATSELSHGEVNALIIEKGKGTHQLGDQITVATALRWIAQLGGYAGTSAGPPGTTVLARGLRSLAATEHALFKAAEFDA
jgi:hypothetical protein